MRKLLVVAFCLLTFGTVTMAQTKMETKWHCSKPTASHKFDVGDVPDHSYAIVQGTCAATSSTTEKKPVRLRNFRRSGKDRPRTTASST